MGVLFLLLRRELLVSPRRRWFYLKRLAVVLAATGVYLFAATKKGMSGNASAAGLALIESISPRQQTGPAIPKST